MPQRHTLHFIVPCYNPDEGWEKILADKFHELETAMPDVNARITLVNDGSVSGTTDESIHCLKNSVPSLRILGYPENKGKGFALRYGLNDAEGDYFIYTDIDFPYTIPIMVEIYNGLLNGADVVVGIRESEYYDKLPKKRVVITKIVKQLIKYFLKTTITDTQCGLKGFNRKGKDLFLKTSINRFLFDMQFVKMASADKSLIVKPQFVYSRRGIRFSHMTIRVLVGESFDFIWMILKRGNRAGVKEPIAGD